MRVIGSITESSHKVNSWFFVSMMLHQKIDEMFTETAILWHSRDSHCRDNASTSEGEKENGENACWKM